MEHAMSIRFYVATNGSDQWSGRLAEPDSARTDGPFATLYRARNAIRQVKSEGGLTRAIEVWVRGGTYVFTEPLRLSAGDSGTSACPITYRAYPDETPVLSGGRPITGWKPYKRNIVCTQLAEVESGLWKFRQLFCNNKRMVRSRWPKFDKTDPLYGGWAFVESVLSNPSAPHAFRFQGEPFPHDWRNPRQAEVVVIPGNCWISDIIPVKEADRENRTIHLIRPVGPSNHTLGGATHLRAGNRFYVENNLEDLTEPGEWCLDTDSGTLYFWPPGEELEGMGIIAPVTARLIQLIGSPANPLKHVAIKGFTFRHTQEEWPTPESYYKTPNAGQTVYLENTEQCAIEDNVFDAVGGDAIRLQNGNSHNRITGNHIFEAGASGIFVGSFQKGFSAHDPTSGDLPSPVEWHNRPGDADVAVCAWPRSTHLLISNNHIHHIGKFEKHAHGIAFFGVAATDVVVSHNLIHDTPRFGIGMMSGLGRIIVEYNDLYNLSLETADTGGICSNRWYTYDKDSDLATGCIIRFNRVRDVLGCGAMGKQAEPGGQSRADGKIWAPYYSWAIYFDNAPMNTWVYGNICARNTLGGIMISHWGKNVTVENNIFVDSGKFQAYMLCAGNMSNIRVQRNIFCYSDARADFMRLNLEPGVDLSRVFSQFDHNLYSPPDNTELRFAGLPGEAVRRTGIETRESEYRTFDDWQAAGFDRNSVIADPGFLDAASENYELKPDSPAMRIGFMQIDSGRIGLLP